MPGRTKHSLSRKEAGIEVKVKWQELVFTTAEEHVDLASDFLTLHGALAISLEAGDNSSLFCETLQLETLWKQTHVIALFDISTKLEPVARELQNVITLTAGTVAETRVVIEEDWVKKNQEQFTPQLIKNKLWIYPSKCEHTEELPFIKIDPGLAFGTGTHPTTQLCLEWLCKNDLKNKTIIDYGCGSGILALAALSLGAKTVFAIDHDEQALVATRNNATLNHKKQEQNLFIDFDNSDVPAAPIIVANMLAAPLKSLVNRLHQITAEDGILVTSGLIAENLPDFIKTYSCYFEKVEQQHMNEWFLISWKRKSST